MYWLKNVCVSYGLVIFWENRKFYCIKFATNTCKPIYFFLYKALLLFLVIVQVRDHLAWNSSIKMPKKSQWQNGCHTFIWGKFYVPWHPFAAKLSEVDKELFKQCFFVQLWIPYRLKKMLNFVISIQLRQKTSFQIPLLYLLYVICKPALMCGWR